MPRLKPSKKQEAIAKFEALITEGLIKQGLNKEKLAMRMCISTTKLRTIRKSPLRMTFSEARRISIILGIPEEHIHEILRNIPIY